MGPCKTSIMEQFNGAIYRAVYTTCKVFKYVVFSGPNTGKKNQKKLRIWTILTQCEENHKVTKATLKSLAKINK